MTISILALLRFFLPRRAVLAATGAVGMFRAPVVDHCHNIAKRTPAIPALVWPALAAVVGDVFPAARAVWVFCAPSIQQRTQRAVLRSAIDADVFAALPAPVQSMLPLAGSARMLRAPAVQQRPRITRRRSTVLAAFAHMSCNFLYEESP